MTILNCECKRDCLLFSAIASIIIGIIVAFLRITGVITVTPQFVEKAQSKLDFFDKLK